MAVKDAELKKVLEIKAADMEELKNKLRTQERESQSELLKLQLEVTRAKLLFDFF